MIRPGLGRGVAILTGWLGGCALSREDPEGQPSTTAFDDSGAAEGDPSGASGEGSDSGTTASDGASSGAPLLECTPDIASITSQIFVPSCLGNGCHTTIKPAGGLDLESPDVQTRLVQVASATCEGPLVAPGDAQASWLYLKLFSEVSCGMRMPYGSAALPESAITCISEWIDALSIGDTDGCETCGTTVCVELATDVTNCGSCAHACPSGVACSDGECQCPAGTTLCGPTCADTGSDPAHCGGCDLACGADQVCNDGMCTTGCGALTACDGACVDTQTNPQYCGSCTTPCGLGQSCTAGTCACSGPQVSYSADVAPLLEASCTAAGCHTGVKPKESLDLRLNASYGELVTVPSRQCNDGRLLVASGDPDASYLVDKLLGIDLCSGTQMPKAGGSLAPAELDIIVSWICRGAPND